MGISIRSLLGLSPSGLGPPKPPAPPAPPGAAAAPGAASPADRLPGETPLEWLYRLKLLAGATERQINAAACAVYQTTGPVIKRTYERRWRHSSQDIEDLFQQAMLKFLSRAPARCHHPEAMFHRIIINLLKDKHRRANGGLQVESLDLLAENPQFVEPRDQSGDHDPYEAQLVKDVRSYLVAALTASSRERGLVLQLLIKGASNDEIAQCLNISPGAARDRVLRVRQLVKQIFLNELK